MSAVQSPLVWLPLVFFIIALFYSSVGFGGGSSYLAVLSLVLTDFPTIRTVALLCNVVVVVGNVYVFWRAGALSVVRALPFVVVSVPAAFLGGTLPLTERRFFVILGGALIVSALLLVYRERQTGVLPVKRPSPLASSVLGGSIGLLAGVVGIGGGIFLSPWLHLMRWDTAARIAALASFFILVNSLAGLGGLLVSGEWRAAGWLPWVLLGAVVGGGQLGSRLGLSWLGPRWIRLATAALVLYVGLRLVVQHGPVV